MLTTSNIVTSFAAPVTLDNMSSGILSFPIYWGIPLMREGACLEDSSMNDESLDWPAVWMINHRSFLNQ